MVFLPAVVVCIVPAFIIALRFKGKRISANREVICTPQERKDGRAVLFFRGGTADLCTGF